MSFNNNDKRITQTVSTLSTITVANAAKQDEHGAGLWLKSWWDAKLWYLVLNVELPDRDRLCDLKLLSGYQEILVAVRADEKLYYQPSIEELRKEITATLANIRSSHQNGTIVFNRFDTIMQADAFTRALWLAGWIQQNETF